MLRSSIADIFEPRNELADFDEAVLDIGILTFSSGTGLQAGSGSRASSTFLRFTIRCEIFSNFQSTIGKFLSRLGRTLDSESLATRNQESFGSAAASADAVL